MRRLAFEAVFGGGYDIGCVDTQLYALLYLSMSAQAVIALRRSNAGV